MKLSNSEKVNLQFYQALGNLFFSVAIADKTIHPKELTKLKILVREKWLPLEDTEDEYGTDASYQIESVFEGLLEFGKQSEESYQEFVDFYRDHNTIFGTEVKLLILDTAHSIANSFAGKNKSELAILAKLVLLFSD